MTETTTASRVAALAAEVPDIPRADEAQIGAQRFSYRGYEAVAAAIGPLMRRHGLWLRIRETDVAWMEERCSVTVQVDWCSPEGTLVAGRMSADATARVGLAGAQTTAVRHLLVLSLLLGDAAPEREDDPPDDTPVVRMAQNRPSDRRTGRTAITTAKQHVLAATGGDKAYAAQIWRAYDLEEHHGDDRVLAEAVVAASSPPPPNTESDVAL